MTELDANELNRREQVTQHYTSALKDLSAQSRAENERIKAKYKSLRPNGRLSTYAERLSKLLKAEGHESLESAPQESVNPSGTTWVSGEPLASASMEDFPSAPSPIDEIPPMIQIGKRKGKSKPEPKPSAKPQPVEPLVIDPPSICVMFPWDKNETEPIRTPQDPREVIINAQYQALPSFDHVTPLYCSRPGEGEPFDHHPLAIWHPEAAADGKAWKRKEKEILKAFWKAADEMDQPSLHQQKEHSRYRDPFKDKARIEALKRYLETYEVKREHIEELAVMFEIPLDETLVAYLLEKVDATSEYKAQWTQFLLAGFNTFSDLFDMPVVYMMDSYRETFSQSQKRQHWAERKAAYPLGFSSICPLHLLFDCPHHEAAQSYDGPSKKKVFSVKELSKDLRPDSDTRLRPKGAASKNHFGTQRVRGVKQDPCSDECYLRKKLDVGSSGETAQQILASWSSDDRQTFEMLRSDIHEKQADACAYAVVFPGKGCAEMHDLLRKIDFTGYSNQPISLANPPPIASSSKPPQGVLDTEAVSTTLRVAEYRPPAQKGKAKVQQARKTAGNDGDDSDPDEVERKKNYKLVAPNETDGYIPCSHPGIACVDATSDECSCVCNRTWCDKFCGCDVECRRRFPGCHDVCHSVMGKMKDKNCRTDNCPCFKALRECDPELCCTPNPGLPICGNMDLQLRRAKKCYVGYSNIEGLGLFAGEVAVEGDLIQEYRGEIIDNDEANKRSLMYNRRAKTYFYELDRTWGIDSEYFGNRTRYINAPLGQRHGDNSKAEKATCTAKVVYVLGEHRIGVYCSSKKISVGREMTMDYGKLYEFSSPV